MVFPAGQRFALLWIYLVRMLSCFVNILKHFFLFIRSSVSVQVPLSCKPLIGTSFPDSSGLSDDFLDNGIHYMHHEQFTNMGISLFVGCSLIQVSVVLVVKIPHFVSCWCIQVAPGISHGMYSSFIQQLHMH